jgi:hypothetical protein
VPENRKWFLTDIPAAKMPLEVLFENDREAIFEAKI